MSISAVLLAAGESTRMGRLKQLLPWDGQTLLAWQVEQLRAAGADDVVVVVGHAAEEVGREAAGQARPVLNPDYRLGRASSLRCGAQALEDASEAVLVLSVDQPRPAWLSRRLIDRWRAGGAQIVSPRFPRGFGHPVLLDGRLLPELRNVNEETLGLRAVTDRHKDKTIAEPISNATVDVDLNTPGDYEAALISFARGDWTADTSPC